METSFDDCRHEPLSKAETHGHAAYEQWRNRDVVRFVERFTHRFIYTLSPTDVLDTAEHTGHALGDVQAGESVRAIQDFTCPFALSQIFHASYAMNDDGRAKRKFVSSCPVAKAKTFRPLL
jgi:hypothetical protein